MFRNFLSERKTGDANSMRSEENLCVSSEKLYVCLKNVCVLSELFETYFQEALCLLEQLAHKSIEILFYSI